MRSFRVVIYFFLLSSIYLTSCSSVKSVVPGMGSDKTAGPSAGEKLHFKVTPEQALVILDEVATQNEWKLVDTGDQFDMYGPRGKFFRLETERFLGGPQIVSGAFFTEPTGCYVVVGKRDTGLPQDLAAPFIAAVEEHTKGSGGS